MASYQTVEIHTQDRYDYEANYIGDVSNLSFIVFSVQAKNDAHIGLKSAEGKLWEIVLGGWNNT